MSYNKDFDVIHSQQALLIRNMGSMKDLRIGSHGGKHGRSSSLSNISRNLELSQQEVIFKYLKNKSRSNMISRKTKQGVKRKLKSHSSSKIESKREKKSTKKKQKKKLFFLKQQFKSLKLSENQKMARNNRANHKAYEKSSFLTSVNFLQKKKGSFKKRRGLMTLGNQTPLTKKNSLFTPEATHVGGNKPKSRSKLEEGTLLGDKFNMSESITTNKPSETELGSVIQLNKKYIREALDKQSQNLELRTELFLAHLKTPKKEINSTGYKTEDREEYRRIKRLLSKRHHSGRKAKRLNYQEQREIINKKVDIFDYLPKRTSQIDFILKYENFPFLSSEFFGGYFEKISGNFSMLGSTSISSFLNLNSRKSRTGVENFNNGNFQKKFQTRFDTHEREFKEYMRRYRKNQNPDRDDYTSVITWFDKIYPKIAKPRCRSHKKLTSLKDIPDDSVRHKSQDNSFVDPQTGDHDFHGFSRYLQDYSKILGLLSKEVIDMLTRTSKEASFAVKKIYSESLKLMEITFEFFQKCISGTAKIHSREIKKLQQNYKELLDNKNTMLEERKDIIIRKEVEIEHLKKKCNVLSHKLSNDIIAMRNLRSEISHVNELSNLLKEEKLKVFDIVADLFKSVESFKLKANDTANKHQVGDPATFEELEYKIETIFKIKDDFQDETVFLKQQKRENEKRNLEQNISEKDISHLKNELQRDFDYQYDGYSAKNRCIQVVPNQEYFIDEYSQTVGNIKTRDFCEQVMITTCPKCLQLKKANRESKNQIDDLMYKLSRMDTENKELKKMRTNAFSSEKREIQDSVENISSGTLGEGSLSPDGVARWSRADGSPRRLSDAKKGSPKEGRRRRRRRSKFSKMVSVDRERRRSSLMSRSSRGSSKKKANSPSGGRVKPSQMYRKSLVAVSKDSIVEDNSLDEILSRTSKKSVSGPGNTLEPPTIQVNFQLPETLSRNIDVTMSPTKSRMSDTDIKDIIKKFIGTSLDTLKHQMTGFEQLDPHSQDTFQKELENCQNIFERIDLFERRESRFQNEGFKIVVTQESEMNSDSEGDDAVRPLLQPIRTDSKRRGKLRRSQSEALSMQDLARLGVEPQTPISPLLPSRYSGSPRKQKFSLKASRPSKKFSKTLRRQTTFGFTSHKDREGMLMVNLSKKRFNEMTSLASNTFNETIASLKSEGIDREKVVATKKTMVKKVLGIYKDYADDLKKKEGRQSMVDLHIFAFKMINDKNSNKKIAVKKYQLFISGIFMYIRIPSITLMAKFLGIGGSLDHHCLSLYLKLIEQFKQKTQIDALSRSNLSTDISWKHFQELISLYGSMKSPQSCLKFFKEQLTNQIKEEVNNSPTKSVDFDIVMDILLESHSLYRKDVISDFFQAADLNGDGSLDFEEFIRITRHFEPEFFLKHKEMGLLGIFNTQAKPEFDGSDELCITPLDFKKLCKRYQLYSKESQDTFLMRATSHGITNSIDTLLKNWNIFIKPKFHLELVGIKSETIKVFSERLNTQILNYDEKLKDKIWLNFKILEAEIERLNQERYLKQNILCDELLILDKLYYRYIEEETS